MAKNYESESKNSRNYTGTSDKNSYGNEMNHAGNAKNSVKSKNETDCRSKAHLSLISYDITKRSLPCFRWKRSLQKCWIIMWTEGTR